MPRLQFDFRSWARATRKLLGKGCHTRRRKQHWGWLSIAVMVVVGVSFWSLMWGSTGDLSAQQTARATIGLLLIGGLFPAIGVTFANVDARMARTTEVIARVGEISGRLSTKKPVRTAVAAGMLLEIIPAISRLRHLKLTLSLQIVSKLAEFAEARVEKVGIGTNASTSSVQKGERLRVAMQQLLRVASSLEISELVLEGGDWSHLMFPDGYHPTLEIIRADVTGTNFNKARVSLIQGVKMANSAIFDQVKFTRNEVIIDSPLTHAILRSGDLEKYAMKANKKPRRSISAGSPRHNQTV